MQTIRLNKRTAQGDYDQIHGKNERETGRGNKDMRE
jgi:hypothetical protein